MACLVPLLALAAGAGLQAAGAQQAQDAMNRKTSEELQRQKKIQDKSKKVFSVSLGSSGKDTAERKIDEGQAQREQAYTDVQAVPLTQGGSVIPQGNSSSMMLRDASTRMLGNKSRANLGGYDTWLLDNAIKNIRANQNLNMNSQEAQRSQAILPMELQSASHAGDTLAGIGSIVQMAGSLYGLGGMGAGAAASGGSSAAANPGIASWLYPGLVSTGKPLLTQWQ